MASTGPSSPGFIVQVRQIPSCPACRFNSTQSLVSIFIQPPRMVVRVSLKKS